MNSALLGIPGFRLIRLDRLMDKRGGGVAIYINLTLPNFQIDNQLNISNNNIELLTIKISRENQKAVYTTVVYIPPKANISDAISHLDSLAEHLSDTNTDWVICGDFNIDLSRGSQNRHKKSLHNFSSRYQLRQLIHSSTRTCKTSSTIIDHIYSNIDTDLLNANVLKYGVSDHDLTFVTIKKATPNKERESFVCCNMRDYTLDYLPVSINNLNWSSF